MRARSVHGNPLRDETAPEDVTGTGELENARVFSARRQENLQAFFGILISRLDDRARIGQSRDRVATGRQPQGAVVPLLCAGAMAFARGDHAMAVGHLGAALHDLTRIGGSHAQREVFEDTYIVACLRAGARDKAKERLKARLARRPSARDERWLAEATA